MIHSGKSKANEVSFLWLSIDLTNFKFKSNLVIGLRKQILEIKSLISKKEENLGELKKNPNFLKVQELDREIEEYARESQKIQEVLNEILEKELKNKEYFLMSLPFCLIQFFVKSSSPKRNLWKGIPI